MNRECTEVWTKAEEEVDPLYDDVVRSSSSLLTEFVSHVYLGQWECARACALTALRAPFTTPEDKQFIRDYVESVAVSPDDYSTCSNSLLVSPNHLSWLATKFLEDHSSADDILILKHDAEFRVLLCSTCKEFSEPCRQELYQVYCDGSSRLSAECKSSLRVLLAERPAEASLLLSHATQRLGRESASTLQLWELQLDAVRQGLETLKESLSHYEEVPEKSKLRTLGLLVLLPEPAVEHSLMDPQWAGGSLEGILSNLLDLTDGGVVGKQEALEALVCRESVLLLQAFAERENERHGRLPQGNDTLSCMAVSDETGQLDLQEAFLKSLVSGEHFVDTILKVAVRRLHAGQHVAAARLFSHPALRDFYATVLVCAWDAAGSDDHASCVMHAVEDAREFECTSRETELFLRRLRYHLVVTDWIVSVQRKRKTSLTTVTDEKSRRRTVYGMLQHQSVLRVIHKTLGLGGLDHDALVRLLAGVTFECQDAEENVAESLLQRARTRDCMMYRSYLTMQSMMEAFHAGILLHQLGLHARPSNRLPQHDTKNDSKNDTTSWDVDSLREVVQAYGFQKAYECSVLAQLSRFESQVGQVSPLTLRLELLENAFSLLFVTHNNLRKNGPEDEDTTDVEDDAKSDDRQSGSPPRREVSDVLDAADTDSPDKEMTAAAAADAEKGGKGVPACKETSDSLSGKGSTASSNTGSSAVGFLCPPFLVPDVLATLSSAILATRALSFATSSTEAGESTSQTSPVQTSVSWSEFPSRLDQLQKHVLDAQWRYDLITSSSESSRDGESPLPQSEEPPRMAVSSEGSRDEDAVPQRSSRKSKRRRRYSSPTVERTQWSIIEKMLASSEALLRHCLWHGNYGKADQVVQMLKLGGSPDAQEVHFSRRLEEVTRHLESLSLPSPEPNTSSVEPTAAVSRAAREGLHLTTATALVDRLLCADGVPGISEADQLLHRCSLTGNATLAERGFAEEYGGGGPHAAAVADLALTAEVPRDVSERLLALAVSKRRSEGNPCGRVRRLSATLESLRQFLQESNEGLSLQPSMAALLAAHLDDFDAVLTRRQREAWASMQAAYQQVAQLLECQLNSSPSSPGDGSARVELHRCFLHLAKVMDSELRPDLPFLPPSRFDYLRSLYGHVRQLHKAVREALQQGKNRVGRLPEDSYFWVLSQSPSALLARLVLKEEVAPSRLESLAHQMKLNLAHVLARECCPRIILTPGSPSLDTSDAPRILNDNVIVPNSARHPNFVVKCLLKDLIVLLRARSEGGDALVTLEAAGILGRSSAFASWTVGCGELSYLDLEQLSEGPGRLAFFLNLTNLLTVHAALVQAASIPPQEMNRTSFVPITSPFLHQRSQQETQVAYRVGQLGVVTLFHLKRRLLFRDHPLDVLTNGGGDPLLDILMSQDAPLEDNWAPAFHPKVVFALVQGRLSDPKLEVIYPETIETQFQAAVDRCMAQIKAITRSGVRTIILPWQMNFFLTSQMQFDESSEELRTALKQIIPEGFVVDLQKEDPHFGVVLDGTVPVLALEEAKKKGEGSKLPPAVLSYLESRCPPLVRLLRFMLPKVPKDPHLEEVMRYRGSPLENLLGQVYGLWMQVATSEGHAPWMAMALTGHSRGALVWEALQGLAAQGDWVTVLSLLELVDGLDGGGQGQRLDLVAHRRNVLKLLAAHESTGDCPGSGAGPWRYAMRIGDLSLRAECILASYVGWPHIHAAATLELLCSECLYLGDSKLHQEVARELSKLELYQEIAGKLAATSQGPLFSWKDVAKLSVSDPALVLEQLRSHALYDAAALWVKLHVFPDSCRLISAELKALHLLSKSPPESEEAYQLTEHFNKECEAFPLWQRVLERLPHDLGQILLVQHLVDNYKDCLMDSEVLSYKKLVLGLRMYACIDAPKQHDYVGLVYHPLLLLEQLLMNAEVDSVGKSLESVSGFLDQEEWPLKRSSANTLLETYASKALELLLLPSPSSEPDTSQPASGSSVRSNEGGSFTMPAKPPPESEWVPDTEVSCCMACSIEYFSMFSRRHHCRRCGRVVCSSCSQHSLLVEGYGKNKVRVCDDCFSQTTKQALGADEGTPSLVVDQCQPGCGEGSLSKGAVSRSSSFARPPLWLLSANEEENTSTREHFYYERAPSVSLCLSILEKHSSLMECATFILSLCDNLFAVLAPKSTSEKLLDYGLIITILKSLVLRAKVKFMEVGVSSGVSWSEAYLRRLDIVRLMVNTNCQDLLPDEMLLGSAGRGELPNGGRKFGNCGLSCDPGLERKLRDRLMETERMSLALEVSTKCALETSGVFAAWGLAMLRAGDWAAARDKFTHCLQKPKDRANASAESPLLKEIIENLENSFYPGISKVASVFCAIASLKGLKDPNVEVKVPMSELQGAVFGECKHYLDLYGSHRSMLSFLYRHGKTTSALEYYLSKGCEAELFLEVLLVPAMERGDLEALLLQVRELDSTLSRWWPTLLATCRGLQKRGYAHTLYQLQLFMEDYLRAAVTSIEFFEKPAPSSYSELHGRLCHLSAARSHLETYLAKYATWEGHRAHQKGTQVLAMAPKEVNRNVSMVNLQIEVTRFLNARELEQGKLMLPRDSPENWQPPTLFGDVSKKTDLACLVITNGSNVDEGFGLAFRVIQEQHLEGGPLFERAGAALLLQRGPSQVERLVSCIKSCGYPDKYDTDAVVLAALREWSQLDKQKKDLDMLIRCIKSDIRKVEAYMLAGRLKTAYLLAVRQNQTELVRRIMVLAEEAGQESVRAICEKRLQAMAALSQ